MVEIVTVSSRSSTVDELVAREWREGVSAGAAARQVCRSLDPHSSLKRLLETLLAEANQASHERYQIVEDVRRDSPPIAYGVARRSYLRINGLDLDDV
jgi:hypothetical protein